MGRTAAGVGGLRPVTVSPGPCTRQGTPQSTQADVTSAVDAAGLSKDTNSSVLI